jgi:hypothetical protein
LFLSFKKYQGKLQASQTIYEICSQILIVERLLELWGLYLGLSIVNMIKDEYLPLFLMLVLVWPKNKLSHIGGEQYEYKFCSTRGG